MKRAITSLLFFLLCPASLPAQTQKPLLLGLASISGGIETLYVTKKIGAFKRNGLDVDFLLLQGGSQALQVLLSGEIKLISGGGGTAAQRARFKGAGNVIVATYTPTMPYSLYVNGKIQDAKKLKGAKIAISRFGSSSDFAARFMVSRLGLDPAKDVTIMQIGNQRERMSALLSGSVDGSVVDAPNTLIARQQGFLELADASKLGLTYPHNNIATTDRFIREEPQTRLWLFTRVYRGNRFLPDAQSGKHSNDQGISPGQRQRYRRGSLRLLFAHHSGQTLSERGWRARRA